MSVINSALKGEAFGEQMLAEFPTSQPDQRLGLHELPRAIRTREVLPEKSLLALPVLRVPALRNATRYWISNTNRCGLVITAAESATTIAHSLGRFLPSASIGVFAATMTVEDGN
jgi:hypothetical protein